MTAHAHRIQFGDAAARADDPHPVRRWLARIAAGTGIAVAVLVLTPIGSALAFAQRPTVPDHPDTAVERAVAALVGDRPLDALALVPDDFERRFGYLPVVVDGRPANPGGDCSSPVPLPDRFENACRTHDFGYDLLRYADATGTPAQPWARIALDAALIDQMHSTCSDPTCDAAAETARAGLAVNTWRQRSGPPVAESSADIAGSYLTRVGATLVGAP